MTKSRCVSFALLLAALLTLGMGCELIAQVDRGKISGSGGDAGQAGSAGTGAAGSAGTAGAAGTAGTAGTATGGSGGTMTTSSSGGTGGSPCVPEDDNNECTDDACDPDGNTVHTPKAAGSACMSGGSQCDGNGECVDCLAPADCPGVDDACQTRICTMGTCGFDFTAAGTALPTQMAGDCQLVVCDGNGKTTSQGDDADLPDDKNPCTDDLCVNGAPANPAKTPGTSCGQPGTPLVCNDMGQCVGCVAPTDCQGTDDECATRKCNAGVCGFDFTAADTPVAAQTEGDCVVQVCDGAGNVTASVDDTDEPDDDGNACTDDTCAAGAPIHPNKANGTTCDDGDACSLADTCESGACAGGNPVQCMAQDQCHDAGTCDPASGACGNPAKPDGAACSDNDSCTQSDSCLAGSCTAGPAVTCSAQDQCHDAGTCDPATGMCSNPTKADGAACNDNSACTQSDTCLAGACTGQNPVTCSAQDQCHDAGTCDPATGLCSNPQKADGAACNDNSACTQSDTCQAGACNGGNPVTCTAQDQCHDAGTCDPATGACSNPQKADGAACSDSNGCTQSDSCQSGNCIGSNPVTCTAQDTCHTAGTCDPGTGQCSNPVKQNGSACSDGNACTQSDSCQNGSCTGQNPVTCSPQDQCHVAGICDPGTGVCSNPSKADGSFCDDGSACSQLDTCVAGVCSGGDPVICMAQDTCHSAGTCDPGTGTCSNPVKADGASCDDGDLCTQTDSCTGGICNGASPVTCSASDQCHVAGVCNPGTGACSNPIAQDGLPCINGGVPGACANGVCGTCGDGTQQAGEQCDDGNFNNGDGCDNNCTPTACGNGVAAGGEQCDDGNTVSGDGCDFNCTLTECGNGVLTAGELCDDGNIASGDGCDSNCTPTMCGNGVVTAPESCDDGNLVSGDGCDSNCTLTMCGNGIPTAPEACDDGNFTNGDGCDTNCTVSACGNGIVAGAEVCDDGNLVNGDGCDFNCTISSCGNGILTAGEVCDDGNQVNGDGCDNNCTATACGNGVTSAGEACDDGNLIGSDGCTAKCVVEPPYNCAGTPSVCTSPAELNCNDGKDNDGDSLVDCADPNCALGCNASVGPCGAGETLVVLTAADTPKTISDPPAPAAVSNITFNGTGLVRRVVMQTNITHAYDGDIDATLKSPGNVTTDVTSDNGGSGDDYTDTIFNSSCPTNVALGVAPFTGCFSPEASFNAYRNGQAKGIWSWTVADDGASDTGTLNNWRLALCLVPTNCGDNAVDPGEGCDDGNAFSGDACDPNCTVPACGNGFLNAGETCDDGNLVSGDGCDANCKPTGCGNGVVTAPETCDDGNLVSGDGCDANCKPTGCGNGVLTTGEQCEDNNTASGDGCSMSCQVEPFYQCTSAIPAVCTKQETKCNDGLDNDGDGLTDVTDGDCTLPAYFAACAAGQSRIVYKSVGVPVAIPDNVTAGVTTQLVATLTGSVINKTALLFNITHTYDGDLALTLTPPSGANLDASSNNGTSGQNFINTILDTTCATNVTAGSAPFSGCYRPEATFATLNNTSPLGIWKLKVVDGAANDTGTLTSWALVLCTTP